jgi:hypothetical protein
MSESDTPRTSKSASHICLTLQYVYVFATLLQEALPQLVQKLRTHAVMASAAGQWEGGARKYILAQELLMQNRGGGPDDGSPSDFVEEVPTVFCLSSTTSTSLTAVTVLAARKMLLLPLVALLLP